MSRGMPITKLSLPAARHIRATRSWPKPIAFRDSLGRKSDEIAGELATTAS